MLRPQRLLSAALGVVILSAGACAPGAGSNSTPTSATFVEALPSVATSLDVAPYGGDPHRALLYALGSKLWDFNTTGLSQAGCTSIPGLSNISGDLVQSWSYNSDRTVITVKLKDYTSQYGHKLTSADVAYSIQRMLALTGGFQSYLMFVIAHYRKPNPIDVIDDHTFTLTLAQSTAYDLAIWSFGTMMILDSTEVKAHATSSDPWATSWVSTHVANFGPWALQSFDSGNQVTLTVNKGWKGTRGNVTKFIEKAVSDPSIRQQLVQSGQADWADHLPYDQLKTIKASTPSGTKILRCESANRDFISLAEKVPQLGNVMVRTAISEAIDRPAINNTAYDGFGTPSATGLSSVYGTTAQADRLQLNVANAKALLAQAGYPNGFSIQLTYCDCRPGPQVEQSSVLIQQQLAAIGITVTLNKVASDTDFVTLDTKEQYQMLLNVDQPIFADPAYSASFYVTGNAALNDSFSSAAVDALEKQLVTTQPGSQRDQLTQQMAALLAQQVPVIWLVDVPNTYYIRSNISGYQHAPSGDLRPWMITKG